MIELDGGEPVHLADIASIGPAKRTTRRHARRDPRLAACAHAFGYRGHCLTKSRRSSTTFKQLRADREAFAHAQILARSTDATQRVLAAGAERIVTLAVDGIGHVTTADAFLAAEAAAHARGQVGGTAGAGHGDPHGRQAVSEKVATVGSARPSGEAVLRTVGVESEAGDE